METLRLILGDQLNEQHSWFSEVDEDVLYVLMEVRSETDYVPHHIQKVVAFFKAMRHFHEKMTEKGHQFRYIRLDDSENQQEFAGNLQKIIQEESIQKFAYQLPDEYRLDELLKEFCDSLDIETEVVDSEHFLTTREELETHFEGKKTYLMESFYREMRKKHDILMEDGEPAGERWNFDGENRNKYKSEPPIPPYPEVSEDVSEIVSVIRDADIKTIGNIDEKDFSWPTTRAQGQEWLSDFCENRLPWFGQYQDAMTNDEPFLFHSRLSFLMNAKLLHPKEVIDAAIAAWEKSPEQIDLAQIEGFVRQILGWREFMRGIYWAKMPDFASMNYFDHTRSLPEWYWTGDTQMNCLSKSIRQSLDTAYAHHIQRLMVTGNFALLAGIDPAEVDQWYLGIYIDAIEWVEITNTRGMSQFADGGIIGTKPYVSSANYIDKMSDYCGNCHYDKKKKTGDKACPLNSLYWDFYARNEDKLRGNNRVSMMYGTWERMGEEKQQALLEQAKTYKNDLNSL